MEELVHLRLFGVCQEFAGLIEGVHLVPLAQRLQVAEFLESIVENEKRISYAEELILSLPRKFPGRPRGSCR